MLIFFAEKRTYLLPTKATGIFYKGQIKLNADWRAVDSPKKTNKQFFFAKKRKKPKKQIHSVVLFWENLRYGAPIFLRVYLNFSCFLPHGVLERNRKTRPLKLHSQIGITPY